MVVGGWGGDGEAASIRSYVVRTGETCRNTSDSEKSTEWLVHWVQSCQRGMGVDKNGENMQK